MPLDLTNMIPARCPSKCRGDHEAARPAGDFITHTTHEQRITSAADADGITLTVEAFEDENGTVERPYLALRLPGHGVGVDFPSVESVLELVEALARAASELSSEQWVHEIRQTYPA